MTKIRKYMDYLRYEKNYSLHTEISYYNDLIQFQRFVESHFENQSLGNIHPDIIRQWVASLIESGISSRSVSRKLSALKSFYRYLVRVGETENNPAKKVVAPKMKKAIPSFVNDVDMSKILDDIIEEEGDFESFRNRVVVELFYMTGMRRAEIIGLKEPDVDLSSNLLRVTGKRNKQRLIPFGEKTRELILLYLDAKKESVENVSDSFFVRKNGEPLYPMLVYRIVNSNLKWIPTLSKASPHVLRHSFATVMLNNGAQLNAVKEILGHSSLASTEVYTHTSFEELKRIYNQAHPRA